MDSLISDGDWMVWMGFLRLFGVPIACVLVAIALVLFLRKRRLIMYAGLACSAVIFSVWMVMVMRFLESMYHT